MPQASWIRKLGREPLFHLAGNRVVLLRMFLQPWNLLNITAKRSCWKCAGATSIPNATEFPKALPVTLYPSSVSKWTCCRWKRSQNCTASNSVSTNRVELFWDGTVQLVQWRSMNWTVGTGRSELDGRNWIPGKGEILLSS
jgi:hypothetical protein